MSKSKVSLRMCIGCREMINKRNLVRVVRDQSGIIQIDNIKGKSPGRGAYLCLDRNCFDKVLRSKSLDRIFSQKIEHNLYDNLKIELQKRIETTSTIIEKGEIDG